MAKTFTKKYIFEQKRLITQKSTAAPQHTHSNFGCPKHVKQKFKPKIYITCSTKFLLRHLLHPTRFILMNHLKITYLFWSRETSQFINGISINKTAWVRKANDVSTFQKCLTNCRCLNSVIIVNKEHNYHFLNIFTLY